ncbi:7872_t:CDS:2 [Funneliformis caledonium]|uniref:7872_t:CDS:1 n=1 Tax=Funneliformis caledonium TaxID=1117310 RepID=A0A9N9FET5_9GLOM|nr:7872_t:CDS:2 [Funneliformis caledonium]
MFFTDELSEAFKILSNDEFEELFNNLENGINTTCKYFEKWLDTWFHLSLEICHLDLKLRFAKDLENDINSENSNTFGLQEILLNDKEFDKEFEEFCNAVNLTLYEFPLLYNFVKTHIYFIIIHQQQIEKDNLKVNLEEVYAQKRKQRNIPLQEKQPFGEK